MIYGFSAEIDNSIDTREFMEIASRFSKRIQLAIEGKKNDRFKDFEVTYCPILMDPKYDGSYPARSKLRKSKKAVSLCPQLDHSRYISSDSKGREEIYISGILGAISELGEGSKDAEFIKSLGDYLRDLLEHHV